MVAVKWSWLNWANALKSATLSATGPSDPRAPATFGNTLTLGWRNQNVLAIGIEGALSESTLLRGGFNYGSNPVSSQYVNPLLALIGESHLTAGISRRFAKTWSFDAGLEYLLPASVTYTNPQLPFGPNARERLNYIALNLAVTRTW